MRTIEEITAAMTALVDGAAGRSLTDDEVTQYEALENELKGVQRSEAVRARNAAYNVVRTPAGVPSASPKQEDPAAGLRNYLLTGKVNGDITNAQSEGVPSQGGYLVPDLFRDKLIEKLKAFGGFGSLADRYSTGNGNPVEWPTLDDTGNVGEIVQEGNTFSAGADLAFGSNSLSSYSYATGGTGGPLKIPRELVQDSAFDIMGLVTRLFATRIARLQAVHWISGTGVAQPLGALTGRTPVQNAANTGTTFEDLIEAEHALDPAYRDGARWVMHDSTLKVLKKIKDGSGSYIWKGRNANMADGFNEQTINGYAVTIDQAMPVIVNNSPTVQWGIFGKPNPGYVIRDVKDVEILVNPYSSMSTRQIEVSAWARADGTQQDTNAYVTLSGHS